MKKTIKYTAIAVIFALFVNIGSVYAQSSTSSLLNVQAYGIDSIAGYTAHIYSSRTLARQNVTFSITKPDGTVLSIPVKSDEQGVASFDLYDYHTQKAGTYKISARLENGADSEQRMFKVYADEVSDQGSKIEPSKLVANSDGIDKVYLTVTLADRFNNPIKDRLVEVISSRAEDKIQRISSQQFTDKDGKMIFAVSSPKKGVSVYSFMDSTTSKVLQQRLEIAYSPLQDAGGFIQTAYAQAGVTSRLTFGDMPANIVPNADVSFALSAVDSENAIVQNYSATVHFSAEGSNSVYAKLPNDYTFDIDMDRGVKQFSGPSSLNFSQPGTYTVVATDLSDFTIRGEATVTVGTSGPGPSTTFPAATTSNEVTITSPSAGIYNDKRLPISGYAPSGSQTVQIFDNDSNIGSANVADDSSFMFTPTFLADGQHTVFAAALDSEGSIISTSDEVIFTIDSTPPAVLNVKFSPAKGIKTGDVINITVISDEAVAQGAVVFDLDIAELEQDPSNPTIYFTSIQAPLEAGVYPLDVVLVDELGNEGSYEDVASIEVSDNGDASITGSDLTLDLEEEQKLIDTKPGDVFGVTTVPSDQRVTLSWQPALDDKGIANYKIYYGVTASNLNMSVATHDNKTIWYIPNLQNGSEYFFAVAAIDTAGQESVNKSTIVSGIPFSAEPILYLPIEPEPAAPVMQATGPEMIWFVLASIFIAKLYFKKKNKMC